MTTNEERLEELRVASIFACDRAIEALTEYKREALLHHPVPNRPRPWGTFQVWERVRKGTVPYTEDHDPVVNELNRIAASIEYVVNNSTDEVERERCGALIFQHLEAVKGSLTPAHAPRVIELGRTLLTQLFGVRDEDIDMGVWDGK